MEPAGGISALIGAILCTPRTNERITKAEAKEPSTGCTVTPDGDPSTCKTCGAVIGGTKYCSACNDSGSASSSGAPTDGVCTTDNAVCNAKSNGVCTTCKGDSFMFQGGCYATANAPGSTMCEAANAGVCTTAKQGYFVPPEADRDATKQSVIPCGDDSVVTVKDDKQYKGVANCLKCTAPENGDGAETNAKAATCTECASGYFVDTNKESICSACAVNCLTCADETATKCKSCAADTHFLGAADGGQGKCVSCGDASGATWKGVDGCLKCTKSNSESTPATCTECQADRYLKAKTGSTAETCETKETCTGGYFPKDESTGGNKCVQCSSASDGGIENCSACTPIASPTTTVLVKCSACDNSKKVSPGGSSCVANCSENSRANEGACICNSGFAPSGDKCTSSSTNKSALSTGAIAGISVAVIAVVGELVGFLCWWFVCRGKA